MARARSLPTWQLVGMLVGALLLGALIGLSGSGDTGDDEQAEQLRSQLAAAEGRAKSAEAEVDSMRERVRELRSDLREARRNAQPEPTPPPTATPVPATPAPTPAPQAGTIHEDKQWVVDSLQIEEDFAGDFAGTARIRNDASAQRSAVWTISLFKGQELVGAMQGSAQDVDPGRTVTVEFVSDDDYVDGVTRWELQTDTTFSD